MWFHCKTCWIMFTCKFLVCLINCYIYIIKFTNTLLNDLWNLCHQNVIIFSLVSHIVLITMKWQMFQHAWLPIDKYKLYCYTNTKILRSVEPDQQSTDEPCLYESKTCQQTAVCLSQLGSNTTVQEKDWFVKYLFIINLSFW